MADISTKCGQCGQETSVSEYVDPDMAVCRGCGAKLVVPRAMTSGPRPPPAKKEPAPKAAVLERVTVTAAQAVAKRQKRVRNKNKIIAWSPSGVTILIMFFVLTGILCTLRYAVLRGSDLDLFVQTGLFIMLVAYLTVVADGFHDSIMNGLLCLVVPFYFVYYLYTQCDSWILRLLVGILIPTFGLNALLLAWEGAMGIVEMMKRTM